MKNKLLLLLLLTTVLLGCRIENRIYRPGFHVTFHTQKISEMHPEQTAKDVLESTETKNVLTEKSDTLEMDAYQQKDFIIPFNQKLTKKKQIPFPFNREGKELAQMNVPYRVQKEKTGIEEILLSPAVMSGQKIIKRFVKQDYKSEKTNGGLFAGLSAALFFIHILLLLLLIFSSIFILSGFFFFLLSMLAFILSIVFSILGYITSEKGSFAKVVAIIFLIIDLLFLIIYLVLIISFS